MGINDIMMRNAVVERWIGRLRAALATAILERDEARAEEKRLLVAHADALDERNAARDERNAARADLATAIRERDAAIDGIAGMRRQRDDARAEVERKTEALREIASNECLNCCDPIARKALAPHEPASGYSRVSCNMTNCGGLCGICKPRGER